MRILCGLGITIMMTGVLVMILTTPQAFAERDGWKDAEDMSQIFLDGLKDMQDGNNYFNECLDQKRREKFGMLDREKDVGECWRKTNQFGDQRSKMRMRDLRDRQAIRQQERDEEGRIAAEEAAREKCDHIQDDVRWGFCVKRHMGAGY